MIVVDTSVIAYLLIAGDKSPLAAQVYQRDRDWLLPALWRHEFLNVLTTFVRHGGATLDEAGDICGREQKLHDATQQKIKTP